MGTVNPQQLNYLASILSQRGSNSLPYEENMKWPIRQQITAALQEFPSIVVRTSQFVHNDGRVVTLIQMEGTIPMFFKGVQYHVPIKLYLLEGFPRVAPYIYVSPTNNMTVKLNHSFVDPNGYVNVPYLSDWMYPRSNLLDLLLTCSKMFGTEPPLFSKGSTSSSAQPAVSTPRPTAAPASEGVQTMNPMRPGPASAAVTQTYSNQNAVPNLRRSPDDVFKDMAVNALLERLRIDIVEHQKESSSQIESLFSSQKELIRKSEEMDAALRELHREKEMLEQNLQIILTNTSVLEDWLQRNKKESPTVDVDSAFEPADTLSKQALENTATDMALEDMLYSLDKAVHEDMSGDRILSVDQYLRFTRSLSREQFPVRAILLKIRGFQSQSQVANISVRSPFAPMGP